MLTGIVVTNIERNRKEGMPVKEAVLNGSLSRIRPILMNKSQAVIKRFILVVIFILF
jgi:multidrug efflux pump subunit AcrB